MNDTPLKVAPLQCPACGAGVPLRPQAQVNCPCCGAAVSVPPAYLAAVAAREADERLRRTVEPHWSALTTAPPLFWAQLGMVLVAGLPPLATLVALLVGDVPLGRVTVLAQVAVPALLPGAVLWLRHGAIAATLVRFRAALAAAPPRRPGEAPNCRSCGGALAVVPGAIAATCGFCGTDSLIGDLPPVSASTRRLGEALHSLAEAVTALRTRRRLTGLGLVALAFVVGALSVALSLALGGTVGG